VALLVIAAALASTTPATAQVVDDPTPRRCGPVAVIGDSLTRGGLVTLAKSFAAADIGAFRIDAKSLRRITKPSGRVVSGVTAVERMKVSGFSPEVWIIGLGGNDFGAYRRGRVSFVAEIIAMLDVIGPGRRVAWLTIWHGRTPALNRAFTEALRQVARNRPELEVVEWASVLAAHPRWLRPDLVHLTTAGTRARNAMIVEAARSMACAERPS